MVALNYYVVLNTSTKLNMHSIFIESHCALIMISHNHFQLCWLVQLSVQLSHCFPDPHFHLA